MDPATEIKARLSIDELVGQYRQLTKKGRHFVCLCPFHNDTHPSMLVSPDKGIAYCFACNSGGDIFSFYQQIEGVDFRQALMDLAERTGVTIDVAQTPVIHKDEKENVRACLENARQFFQDQMRASQKARAYLEQRKIPEALIEAFGLGYAPDSFSQTYEHLLKSGYSRKEIMAAGMGVQKDLREEKIYDRFRNRIMFPIADHQGRLVGFGGRTLGEDDAKYINSAEGILYSKSAVLYGLDSARETIREKRTTILVEGYFDVIGCHRVGITNVVAVSGTALTEQHVKLLKRTADTLVLCLDQDQAGRDASERAFRLCAAEGMNVRSVVLPFKDPDEAATKDPDLLRQLLNAGAVPYFDTVLKEIAAGDVGSAAGKRVAMERIVPLLQAIASSVEREHELKRAAEALATTPTALQEDMERFSLQMTRPQAAVTEEQGAHRKSETFLPIDIALGIIVLHPQLRASLFELIPPEEGFSLVLFEAIRDLPQDALLSLEALPLPPEYMERAAILLLFCEHHGFREWSQSVAVRELRHNCQRANRDFLKQKQNEISQQLLLANKEGKTAEAQQLSNQYQQLLKLAKMAA